MRNKAVMRMLGAGLLTLLLGGCVSQVVGTLYTPQAESHYDDRRKAEAFDLYLAGARKGSADCQYRVGDMLLFGDGVPMDQAEGLRWLEQAAAQDQVDALRALGSYALNGDFGAPRDIPRSVALLERAAARNDGHAMALLGHIHLTGCGGERRLDTAAFWYGQARQQGFPVPPALTDAATLAKVKPAGCDEKAERRAQVKRAQAGLKALGYYRGAVDGIDGKGTRAAVVRFQKERGLAGDGKIDVVLMRHLRARIFNDPLDGQLQTAAR